MSAAVPTCGADPPPGLTPFAEAWRTETVWALARGIRTDEAFDRMPILADALEDAGCDDPLLLNHCRHCEAHEPDCWALRVIFSGDDPRTAAYELWRITQAVAEAARRGHPDDPDVVPGRKMPYLTQEEREARDERAWERAAKRERLATLTVRAVGVAILAMLGWTVLRAVFRF